MRRCWFSSQLCSFYQIIKQTPSQYSNWCRELCNKILFQCSAPAFHHNPNQSALPMMVPHSPTTNILNVHTHYQIAHGKYNENVTIKATPALTSPKPLVDLAVLDMSFTTSHHLTSWLNGHKPYQVNHKWSETVVSPFVPKTPIDTFIKCNTPSPTMAHLAVNSRTVEGPPPLLMANHDWTVKSLVQTLDTSICTVHNSCRCCMMWLKPLLHSTTSS